MESKAQESNSNKVFRSMHSQTFVTIVLGVLELVYFSLMSRLLTQRDFGLFALITAITTVLTSLSDAGLGSAVIQNKNSSNEFKSTAFTLSIISGIIFSLILFFCASPFSCLMVEDESLTNPFRIMSILMLLQGINNIQNAVFIKKLAFLKLGIYKGIAYIISSVVGVVLAANGYGVYAIVWAVVVNQMAYTLILLWLTRGNHLSILIKRQYVKTIIEFGGWLTATVILRNLTQQADKFIIARLLSVTDVGAINRPNGFIGTISSKVNGIFDTILFPILSSLQTNIDALKSAFEKSISLIVIFSSFLSGIIILGSIYIIDVFFGHQWEDIQPLLWILGGYIIFSGVSRIEDCFFRSLGKMKPYFTARLVNGFIAVGLIIAGCFFGLLGVAFAILARNMVDVIIKFVVLKLYIHFNTIELSKIFIKNTWFPLSILTFLLLGQIFIPELSYYYLWIYVSVLILSIIIFPHVYGILFYNQIYKRYLRPFFNKLHWKRALK